MDRIIYYCDKTIATENENGFVFNFMVDKNNYEDEQDYRFRIGMSPRTAKELLYILFNAVGLHEKKHGEIDVDLKRIGMIVKKEATPVGFQPPESED